LPSDLPRVLRLRHRAHRNGRREGRARRCGWRASATAHARPTNTKVKAPARSATGRAPHRVRMRSGSLPSSSHLRCRRKREFLRRGDRPPHTLKWSCCNR